MTKLRVALYEKAAGPGLSNACHALEIAGFEVTGTTDVLEFQSLLPSANCGVVLAYRLTGDLIPSRLDGAYVPPVVAISPLPKAEVTRHVQSADVLHAVLEPAPRDRVLVRAVTHAVITDILARLRHAADHHPDLPDLVRSAIRTLVKGEAKTVANAAGSAGKSRRTLERYWLETFGPEAPHATDFCRGVLLLRVLVEGMLEAEVVWLRVCTRMGVSPASFGRAAVEFARHKVSELDRALTREPGVIVSRVRTRALPVDLIAWPPGSEPT